MAEIVWTEPALSDLEAIADHIVTLQDGRIKLIDAGNNAAV